MIEPGGNLPSEFGAVNRVEPIQWRGFRAIDKIIILLLPWPAIAILLLPLLDLALLRRVARQPGMRPFISWLVNDGGSWILGGAMLLLAVGVLWWMRRRLINDKRLWYGTGCPACGERELVRVSRQFGDRFYGLIFVPAYRYACRNCTWRGLRIARREHSRQTEAELEAALLRFDPDTLPAERAETRRAMFRDAGDVPHSDDLQPPARQLETPASPEAGHLALSDTVYDNGQAHDPLDDLMAEATGDADALDEDDLLDDLEWIWDESANDEQTDRV